MKNFIQILGGILLVLVPIHILASIWDWIPNASEWWWTHILCLVVIYAIDNSLEN